MSFSVFFLCWFILIRNNVGYIVNKIEKGLSARVFLQDEITEERAEEILKRLKTLHEIEYVELVSKEKAKEEFAHYFPEIAEALGNDNPFPISIYIRLKKTTNSSENLLKKLNEIPGVKEVVYQRELFNSFKKLRVSIDYLGSFLSIIFFIASAVIIGNLILIHIAARKEEIYLLYILGARDDFIFTPFIIFSIFFSLIGATIGILFFKLSILIAEYLKGKFLPTNQLENENLFVILGLSILVGLIATIISTGRYSYEI